MRAATAVEQTGISGELRHRSHQRAGTEEPHGKANLGRRGGRPLGKLGVPQPQGAQKAGTPHGATG